MTHNKWPRGAMHRKRDECSCKATHKTAGAKRGVRTHTSLRAKMREASYLSRLQQENDKAVAVGNQRSLRKRKSSRKGKRPVTQNGKEVHTNGACGSAATMAAIIMCH